MASANVLTFTEANFEQEVVNSSQPVLVDFWATRCGPCTMIAPIIDEIADSKAGVLKVGKVDVEQNVALAARCGVKAVPTLLLFKNGEVKTQLVGARFTKADLLAKIEAVL